MIIAFAVIALIIISGLAIGIYAIFIPFLQNLSQIQAYNTAYYGAIAGVERALLVTRVQQFGHNGSGGRNNANPVGAGISDHNPGNLGIISHENNGLRWELEGTTTRIPKEGQGTVPALFKSLSTSNYNAASYKQSIIVRTEIKNPTNAENYIRQPTQNYQGGYIKTHRRVPEKIGGTLCVLCDENEDGIANDIMILRQRRGQYSGEEFTIIPKIDKVGEIIGPQDTHIRKNIINNDSIPNNIPIISFEGNINPLTNKPTIILSEQNGFGPGFENIKTLPFNNIRSNPQTQSMKLLYNITQKAIRNDGFIYPFLEYYITSETPISDIDRHITGHGKVNPYHVQVQIKKPQANSQSIGSFSIIF